MRVTDDKRFSRPFSEVELRDYSPCRRGRGRKNSQTVVEVAACAGAAAGARVRVLLLRAAAVALEVALVEEVGARDGEGGEKTHAHPLQRLRAVSFVGLVADEQLVLRIGDRRRRLSRLVAQARRAGVALEAAEGIQLAVDLPDV